jgi:hypothetical protein
LFDAFSSCEPVSIKLENARPSSKARIVAALQRQSLPTAPKMSLDDLADGTALVMALWDVSEFHGPAGQEHGVDITRRQSRLNKAVVDSRRDAIKPVALYG